MQANLCPILPIGVPTNKNLHQQLFIEENYILMHIFLRANGSQAMKN